MTCPTCPVMIFVRCLRRETWRAAPRIMSTPMTRPDAIAQQNQSLTDRYSGQTRNPEISLQNHALTVTPGNAGVRA